jgi:hypothetical protein
MALPLTVAFAIDFDMNSLLHHLGSSIHDGPNGL